MKNNEIRTVMFGLIMDRMIASGKAPGYNEIAAELGLPSDEGRKQLKSMFSKLGFPGWLDRETNKIVSFAPFNNSPNKYRLTIDGKQSWFGQ
jgi:hypothetical protein